MQERGYSSQVSNLLSSMARNNCNFSLNLRKEQCIILGGEAEELLEENAPKKVNLIHTSLAYRAVCIIVSLQRCWRPELGGKMWDSPILLHQCLFRDGTTLLKLHGSKTKTTRTASSISTNNRCQINRSTTSSPITTSSRLRMMTFLKMKT